MQINRLLVLAPHTDDAELGCGGSMARLLDEGVEVHVATFSTAEESLPEGAPPTMLRDEFVAAMEVLDIPAARYSVFDFPVRRLSYHRQEVLDELMVLKKKINPDAVFLPSGSDLHQDHQVVNAEGLRAFKDITLWGYELPWNQVTFSANAFLTLETRHLKRKWAALQCYQSQLELHRAYFTWEYVESIARVRGVQIKADFAEAFEVIRIRA